MELPLEDDFSDVLSKAQKGLGLSTEKLAEQAGVEESTLRALRKGIFDREAARRTAGALGLNVDAVLALGSSTAAWRAVDPVAGLSRVSTPFFGGQVNAYLVWDRVTREALAFDCCTEAGPMLAFLETEKLSLEALILTHADGDHMGGLAGLRASRSFPVFASERERRRPDYAEAIAEGFVFEQGRFRVEAFSTPGHEEGHMSFEVAGLEEPVAIVGDALFPGSMGGSKFSYEESLRSLQRILELPGETVLASGHGPLTTVEQERRLNCFSGARAKS